jgi:pimeloyl-ACP methyl ester carboxylesterase
MKTRAEHSYPQGSQAEQRIFATGALNPMPRPGWLPEAVWPFRTSALDVEGCRIAVTDVGRGPTLLFVHTGFWSFIWRLVILHLSDDFRCICFDAPGTGQSDRVPSRTVTLKRAARVTGAIIESLDLRDVTLVVHDLGGPSGIAGAAFFAERIRGLCIVNAFGWRPSGAAFRAMLGILGSPIIREFDALTGVLPRVTASAFGIGRHMEKAGRDAFLAGIGRGSTRVFHAYIRDAAKSDVYRDVEQALAGPFRHLPVTTIFGERNDPLGFQPRWRELFPHCNQVVIPAGNHFPMCDDPKLVAGAIRHLAICGARS